MRITSAPVPVAGQKITVIVPGTASHSYTIINETLGTTIAIMGTLTWGTMQMVFNGTKWLVVATTNNAGVGSGGQP